MTDKAEKDEKLVASRKARRTERLAERKAAKRAATKAYLAGRRLRRRMWRGTRIYLVKGKTAARDLYVAHDSEGWYWSRSEDGVTRDCTESYPTINSAYRAARAVQAA